MGGGHGHGQGRIPHVEVIAIYVSWKTGISVCRLRKCNGDERQHEIAYYEIHIKILHEIFLYLFSFVLGFF